MVYTGITCAKAWPDLIGDRSLLAQAVRKDRVVFVSGGSEADKVY